MAKVSNIFTNTKKHVGKVKKKEEELNLLTLLISDINNSELLFWHHYPYHYNSTTWYTMFLVKIKQTLKLFQHIYTYI